MPYFTQIVKEKRVYANMNDHKASAVDTQYMRHGLALARRGLGRTAPNPSVGCVIVKDGYVVGRGRTGDGGRPHAETRALAQAGLAAKGATAYVTLEPCAHTGKTPPCANALIKAGVARVVIACLDPHAQVNGCGVEMLRDAGIAVTTGVCEDEARIVNAGFFNAVTQNRPFVTLKIATSLDGKIALGNGQSKWITGQRARDHVHALRSRHDAVLTGIGTVLQDDPQLNARISGLAHPTARIVLDSDLRMPEGAALFSNTQSHPLYIFHNTQSGSNQSQSAEGATYINVSKSARGGLDLHEVLQKLAGAGFTRLMVEAGAKVFTSFFERGLWDELYWYRAPKMIGDDGIAAFACTDAQDMDKLSVLNVREVRRIGEDVLEIYENPLI